MLNVKDKLEVRVFGQGAISSLLAERPDIARELAVVNNKATDMISYFEENDSTSFSDYSSSPSLYYRLKSRISNTARRFGELQGFIMLGTVNDHYTDFAIYMTFFWVNYSDRNGLFRLHWDEDKVLALGGFAFPAPIIFNLVADTSGTWKGYVIPLELPIRVHFADVDQNLEAMIIPIRVKRLIFRGTHNVKNYRYNSHLVKE